MKLDFDKAVAEHGVRSVISGRKAQSVFVTDSVMRAFCHDGPGGVPVTPGDILTRDENGKGVLTRPGVETGVFVILPGKRGAIELPVTGSRSVLGTLRRIAMGEAKGPEAEKVFAGLDMAMRSIAFYPRKDNDTLSQVDAWRYVVGGAKNSNFGKMIDDHEFLRSIQMHVMKGRLLNHGIYNQPNPATGIESAYPGMVDIIDEYTGEALKILMQDFQFSTLLSGVTTASPEEMSIWQVIYEQEDSACTTVEDAYERTHEWTESLSDGIQSAMSHVFPDSEFIVKIATAADTDVAFIMGDKGAMLITWPTITRRLIVPFRGIPHLAMSGFEVPTADDLQEVMMEASAIPSGSYTARPQDSDRLPASAA